MASPYTNTPVLGEFRIAVDSKLERLCSLGISRIGLGMAFHCGLA